MMNDEEITTAQLAILELGEALRLLNESGRTATNAMRYARKALGFTPQEFALHLNCNPLKVMLCEDGDSQYDLDQVLRIMELIQQELKK